MKISSKFRKKKLTHNSLSPVSRNTPPRFQKLTESPHRFKLISSKNKKKSINSSLIILPSEKPSKCTKEFSTPIFSPAAQKYLLLSDPEIPYDLHSKNMQRIKNDFTKIINSQRASSSKLIKHVKSIKKNCKDLTKLIMKESRLGREELEEISTEQNIFHEKNAEFFKEVKMNNFFQIQTMLVMYPELIKEVDSTMQTALH